MRKKNNMMIDKHRYVLLFISLSYKKKNIYFFKIIFIKKKLMMFYYKSITVFTILTVSLSISMEISSLNEPERCCEPKQYSSKITLSTGMALPDGKMYTSYVIYLINI